MFSRVASWMETRRSLLITFKLKMAQYIAPHTNSNIFNASYFNTTRQESPTDHWGTPGQIQSQLLAPGGSISIGTVALSINTPPDGIYILSMVATEHALRTTTVAASCLMESSSFGGLGSGLWFNTNSASIVGNIFIAPATQPANTIGIVFAGPGSSVSIVSTQATDSYDVTWSLVRFA